MPLGSVSLALSFNVPIMQLMYSWIRSTLWNIVGSHLSLQLSPNGSETADDPRVERDAIHWIKPNPVLSDEGHYTFGSTCIVSRFDQLGCHLVPARRTLSNLVR